MSLVKISGNASGTGTLTVAAPNTNLDYTLTLPTATGTLIYGTQPSGTIVGTSDTQTLTNKTLTSPTLTTPTIDSAQIPTVSGSAPLYLCRAWVNFESFGTFTPNPSTSKIFGSGNVSSVTKNGSSDWRVNFTTALPDENYSFVFGSSNAESGNTVDNYSCICAFNNSTSGSISASSLRFRALRQKPEAASQQFNEPYNICVTIFR